jgi:hypothetical protein
MSKRHAAMLREDIECIILTDNESEEAQQQILAFIETTQNLEGE